MKNLKTFKEFLNESSINEASKLDSASIRRISTQMPETIYIISKEYFGRPKEIDTDVRATYAGTVTSLTDFMPIDKYAKLKLVDVYGSVEKVVAARGWEEESKEDQIEWANEYVTGRNAKTPMFDVQRGNISKYVKIEQ